MKPDVFSEMCEYSVHFRPLCESVADAQRQTGGEEEDRGDEEVPEPCFQRVLSFRCSGSCAEGDHHRHHSHGQGQTQSK